VSTKKTVSHLHHHLGYWLRAVCASNDARIKTLSWRSRRACADSGRVRQA
jgi:hypothetical protein